jgi:hypothetical protein
MALAVGLAMRRMWFIEISPLYPVTTGLGARGVILTPAFAVALALAWLPAVLLALALMVRDTARTATPRTPSTAVLCWPAGMSPELQHTVRPDRADPEGRLVSTRLAGSLTQVRTPSAVAIAICPRMRAMAVLAAAPFDVRTPRVMA